MHDAPQGGELNDVMCSYIVKAVRVRELSPELGADTPGRGARVDPGPGAAMRAVGGRRVLPAASGVPVVPAGSCERPRPDGGHPLPRPWKTSWPRLLLGGLTLLAAGSARPARVAGQERAQRLIERVDPQVGRPGDSIHLSSGNMPSMTAIRIGLGVANVGFEELTDLVTSEDGAFEARVEVPHWAQRDRVYRFILFDLYFRPIALSPPFHVTDDAGLVQREGRVEERDGCLRLTDIDEVVYALEVPSGSPPASGAGASLTLVGRVRAGSDCSADFTLTVAR